MNSMNQLQAQQEVRVSREDEARRLKLEEETSADMALLRAILDAEHRAREVEEAARRAELYDDIAAMPNGFDTYVGERGVLLSGGQKQRIAIARIFLKNPPILILDEATSALDSVTEAKIQHAFDLLARGRTTLIIAHRLSTIRSAHRILVVQEGRIAEQGSHEELLRKQGAYARLYHTQNLGEIPYETGEDRSDQ